MKDRKAPYEVPALILSGSIAFRDFLSVSEDLTKPDFFDDGYGYEF